MAIFGWLSDRGDPPAEWDLRLLGWTLCKTAVQSRISGAELTDCPHILLVDAQMLAPAERRCLVEVDQPDSRLVMLGVEHAAERAQLIAGGCAEALPALTTLRELDARARRVAELFSRLPRWRSAGPLTLDLFHRDGQLGSRWLGLHPREFGLLWRLADRPGERVTRADLLRDVWRLDRDPETNSLEVHVSRLRGKLARLGLAALIQTVPTGGYRLVPGAHSPPTPRATTDVAFEPLLRQVGRKAAADG